MTPQTIHQVDDALKHETRKEVFQLLERSPGQRLGKIAATLNANRGTIAHHLSILERLGLVESRRIGKYSIYFPDRSSGVPSRIQPTPEEVAVLQRKGCREIARIVMSRPGIIQKDIIGLIGMQRKVLRTKLTLLVEKDLLEEVKVSRTREYFPTRRLEELQSFLGGKDFGV